jgi:ABC-2 type transport system ATP-binding protein
MLVAEVRGVVKQYPSMERLALDGVDLEVRAGSIAVIVGANGCGKTTLMEILSGLRSRDGGDVRVCGRDVVPGGRHRYDVGVQLQDAGLPQRIRVRDAVAAVSCLYADPGPVDDIVGALGFGPQMHTMVDRLSGGWQRRLDIALACIGRPRLLILDEPSSGLDPNARAELWQFLRTLRATGTAVLASTHDLTEAEGFADEVNVMHLGRVLLRGPLDEVLRHTGGSWRLRLIDADARADEAVRNLGHVPLRSGEHITVIGEHDDLEQLRSALADRQVAGAIRYVDVISGPIRLEDVFAYASSAATAAPASV